MAKLGDYKLQGLKDSRLFYMRNPPKFMYVTVMIIILILAGVVVWASTAVKAEEVENSGIVVDSGVNAISNDVAGTIIEVYAKEGDFVSKGDILFKLDASVLEQERRGYETSLKYYENRISLIDEFMDAVENDRPNPFINMGDEREFYEMMKSYENELEQAAHADQKETVRMKYLNNLYSQKLNAEKDVTNGEVYQTLYDKESQKIGYVTRMLNNAHNGGITPYNPFSSYGDETEWYNLFERYRDAWNSARDSGTGDMVNYYIYTLEKDFYTKWYDEKMAMEKNLEQYKPYIEAGDNSASRLVFVNEMIEALNRNSSTNPFNSSSSDPLEVEYYDLFNQYQAEMNQSDLDNKQESVKLKYLSSIRTESNNSSDKIVQLKAQISSTDANIAKYTIKATDAGVVHYNVKTDIGSYIQTGAEIGSLNSGSDKQIELAVSAHDRVRLAVGQDCKFTVDGLLQTEFGCIKGKIYSIANDATVTEKGAFFKIRVSFEDQALVDDKGNQIEIINGMTVKTWTVYENNTYLDYFLDGLGF